MANRGETLDPLPSWHGGPLVRGRVVERTARGHHVRERVILCDGKQIAAFPEPKSWVLEESILGVIAVAAKQSNHVMSRLFVEYHAVQGQKDYDESGLTCFHAACGLGLTKLVVLLLDAGADVDILTAYGSSPLFVAAGMGRQELETIKLLIARGADVDRCGEPGGTALAMAVQQFTANSTRGESPEERQAARLEMISMFLKAGASAMDHSPVTMLMRVIMMVPGETACVRSSCSLLFRLLLEHGADPNQSIRGVSPLHLAAQINDEVIAPAFVRALLEHGADPLISCGLDVAKGLPSYMSLARPARRLPTPLCLRTMPSTNRLSSMPGESLHPTVVALLENQPRVRRAIARRTCERCKRRVELFAFPLPACAGCGTRYCSRECQKIDWRAGHRDVCAVVTAPDPD